MNESLKILFPIFFPIVMGLLLLCGQTPKRGRTMTLYTGCVLIITALSVLGLVTGPEVSFTLFYLTGRLPVYFHLDSMGKIFAAVVSVVWVLAGFFSFEYMKKGKEQKRFFGFYLMVYGILMALDFAGNLITFYIFYEMMTLLSMPLVLHERTKEAIMAGLKYLFYSFCGAYMVLFGLYFVYRYANTLTFTAKGVLDMTLVEGKEGLLLVAAFFMLLGFSVKAGMFPMHGWLPTAHPVAPAPASAALSGIIVKSGVLGIIRVAYYIFGADFLKGTWVQITLITLSLVTVFMGSMLAYLEKGLKKRLAYSTVSQVSYILFGLFLFDQTAMTGSVLHVVFHAFIKCCLFLCAGAIIYQTGKHNVDELRGIGKQMPVTMWCYTICSLALIGIPPASGFISKWYLCIGALHTKMPVISWLGPVILLVSALLTAGYLLPITINGFFPGADYDYAALEKKEPAKQMVIPILILAGLALILGIAPELLMNGFSAIAGQLI
ncbi:MAG: proton-conducting membrane transporter [Lachnospiraceae bacterium]|nr:proton-conducting membrane transporter [Lachnospiraceae bacterium]